MKPDAHCYGCSDYNSHDDSCYRNGKCHSKGMKIRFGSINDRCFGKERERKWEEYKRKPY